LTTKQEVVRKPAWIEPIHCLAFAPTGNFRVSVGTAMMPCDPLAGEKVFDQSGTVMGAAAYAPRGALLAVADDADRSVMLCDALTGRILFPAEQARGYGFLLARLPITTQPVPPEGAGQRPRDDGTMNRRYLQILRDGVCLREREVDVPSGPLTLRAMRNGAALEVQVGREHPLPFQDSFPLPDHGQFGLHWPHEIGLEYLSLERQDRAPAPSPLEAADALFVAEKYEQALELYRSQADHARDTEAVTEARYKAALCCEKINQTTPAMEQYEELRRGRNPWAILASCRLWQLHLRSKDFVRAEAVLLESSLKDNPAQLLPHLPAVEKHEVLNKYFLSRVGVHYVLPPDNLVEQFERQVNWSENDPDLPYSLETSVVALMRAYQLFGNPDKAVERAKLYLERQDKHLPTWDRLRVAPLLAEYTWLLQSQGKASQARDLLDEWLGFNQGRIKDDHYMMPYHLAWLLVERARLDMALKEYKQAEEDVDRCLKLTAATGSWSAQFVTTARLIKGFAREAQHDPAGADQTRREASLSRVPTIGPEKDAKVRYWADAHLSEMLPQLIQAGLTDDLSPEEGMAILLKAVSSYAGDDRFGWAVKPLALLERSTATSYRTMWQPKRGQAMARQYILHEISFPDAVRLPVLLYVHELIRQQAFRDGFSDEQDEIVWDMLRKAFALAREGKVKKDDMLPLGAAWVYPRGRPLPKQLDSYPEVRGPLAYVLAKRCLVKERQAEVRSLLQCALQDANGNRNLERLVQIELARLAPKK
jgi:tetratricopeptide (TPR) repeat protein